MGIRGRVEAERPSGEARLAAGDAGIGVTQYARRAQDDALSDPAIAPRTALAFNFSVKVAP